MSKVIIEDIVLEKIVVIDGNNYIIFDSSYTIDVLDDCYSVCMLIPNESFDSWTDDDSKRYYRKNINEFNIDTWDYITIYDKNIIHNYYDNIPQLNKKSKKKKEDEKFI